LFMPSDSAVGKHKETEALVEAAHKLETLEGGCILSDSDLGEEAYKPTFDRHDDKDFMRAEIAKLESEVSLLRAANHSLKEANAISGLFGNLIGAVSSGIATCKRPSARILCEMDEYDLWNNASVKSALMAAASNAHINTPHDESYLEFVSRKVHEMWTNDDTLGMQGMKELLCSTGSLSKAEPLLNQVFDVLDLQQNGVVQFCGQDGEIMIGEDQLTDHMDVFYSYGKPRAECLRQELDRAAFCSAALYLVITARHSVREALTVPSTQQAIVNELAQFAKHVVAEATPVLNFTLNDGATTCELTAKEGHVIEDTMRLHYAEVYVDGKFMWLCGGLDLELTMTFAENGVTEGATLSAVVNPWLCNL